MTTVGATTQGCRSPKKCIRCEQSPHTKRCKCRLRPYKEGCPGGGTPHHVIPDHCWREKGTGKRYENSMTHAGGLCICVRGRSKVGEHGRIHDLFDKAENKLAKGKPRNTASLKDLEKAAVKSVLKGMKPPPCSKRDMEKQLQAHHKGYRGRLRADAFGKNPNPPSLKTSNKSAAQASGLG